MLTFDVVTTYARHHWETYAQRCVESFEENWPGFTLTTFLDEDLEARSKWLAEFKRRHAGRDTSNYRFDAVRFAHKIAAIELAFADGQGDALIWMDADCVTHTPVDAAWLSGLIGAADFGYLKRSRKYPECGFMIFRRNYAGGELIRRVVEHYSTDALFAMAEWHDCWVIEQVRIGMCDAGLLVCKSLSGDAEGTGHPLVNGPLGARLDHLKGNRKVLGKSRPTDLSRTRTENYWKG